MSLRYRLGVTPWDQDHVPDTLDELGLDGRFELLHDRGCYHNLSANIRDDYAHGVSSPGRTQRDATAHGPA